jgi:hypothetical protein
MLNIRKQIQSKSRMAQHQRSRSGLPSIQSGLGTYNSGSTTRYNGSILARVMAKKEGMTRTTN